MYGFADYASLTLCERHDALLLPKKNGFGDDSGAHDFMENEFCTTSQITFDDEREYLLPEEFVRANAVHETFGESNSSEIIARMGMNKSSSRKFSLRHVHLVAGFAWLHFLLRPI